MLTRDYQIKSKLILRVTKNAKIAYVGTKNTNLALVPHFWVVTLETVASGQDPLVSNKRTTAETIILVCKGFAKADTGNPRPVSIQCCVATNDFVIVIGAT